MPVESVVDGLQHVAEAIHTAATQITGELTGAEAIEGLQTGGEDTLNSLSNGVSLIKGKTESLDKARVLRVSHNRHRYILKIIRFMMRNSLRNKTRIMLPAFVGSLFVPPVVFRVLAPAFAAFGAHLGMEAVEDAHHLITMGKKRPRHEGHAPGAAPNPDKVLDERLPDRMTLRDVIAKAHRADRTTTIEITAAVLGSIDTLPLAEQIPVMGVYALGMTFGVYGATTVLVKMEDWGQRLEAWEPQHPATKLLARTTLPARIGVGLQEASPRLFHAMPWIGAAAKFVTSGRVIIHAIPALETMTDHAENFVRALPVIGNDVSGYISNFTMWGTMGVAAGLGAKAVAKPMKMMLWSKASRALLMQVVLSSKPNLEPPPLKPQAADYRYLDSHPSFDTNRFGEGRHILLPPSSSFTPVTLDPAPERKKAAWPGFTLRYAW